MYCSSLNRCLATLLLLTSSAGIVFADPPEGDDWESLFNGSDLSGWRYQEETPAEAHNVWRVIDGVIDCQPRLTPRGDKSLYTEREFGDYQLYLQWRITDTPGSYAAQVVKPDGSVELDANGNPKTIEISNADSGIYNRGFSKAQVNIWCWPIGSGEVYGYRNDANQPPEVRAAVTPRVAADKPVGEWNEFLITMQGDRLSVELNGELVIENAQLPGIPERGPLTLQHHGGYDEARDVWNGASSLVQFRHLYVKSLD